MTALTIDVHSRKELKKNKVKKIREQGLVPCIIYGLKKEPKPISLSQKDLQKIYRTDAQLNCVFTFNIKNGSEKEEQEKVITYGLDRDAITQEIQHIDFLRVEDKTPVKVDVPTELIGTAPGLKYAGIQIHKTRKLNISCLPSQIPTKIVIDTSKLNIGDFIGVTDIDTEGKYTILTHKDTTIVRIEAPRKAVEIAETAEATEGESEDGEAASESAAEEQAAE